jgi:hypothetical protein
MALVELWWSIAQDPMRRDSDRLEASRLLADRGWGEAAAYVAIEEDNPLGLEDVEAAAEEFRKAPAARPRPRLTAQLCLRRFDRSVRLVRGGGGAVAAPTSA